MEKAPDAFRTIGEVAEWLETPAHVLRFWESRFPQVKPVKRAGGRRYYRREDMALLGGIKHLLHDEGMSIRAVQKLLGEKGVRHVAGFAVLPAEMTGGAVIEGRQPAPAGQMAADGAAGDTVRAVDQAAMAAARHDFVSGRARGAADDEAPAPPADATITEPEAHAAVADPQPEFSFDLPAPENENPPKANGDDADQLNQGH